MKAFITPSYTFTPGASGAGTIDLSSISGFDIKRLIAVINQTRGVLIYSTGSVTLKYTGVSAGVVTLFADTSSHNSGDTLQIVYEGIGQKASASSHAVALSTEQETILSALATSAKQDSNATLLGALTETAPTTDTASSGLNGRLQRVAQRLTSLITLLPASLGQKTKANSLAIVPASDYQFPVTPYNLDLTVAPVSALNGDLVPSVDVSGYKVIYLQNMNSFTGTCTFQGSMDGTLWNVVPANPVSSISIVTAATFNGLSTGLFAVPVTFKYFRLRVTAYTSGTGNVLAMASTVSVPDYATKFFTPNGTIPTTSTNSTVAGTVTSAQITVGTTAVRATVAGTAPNAARKLLLVKPSAANTGRIFIGPSTVTTANSVEVIGPDRVEFDFDAGDYFLISDTAGQTVEILEKV